MEKSKKEWEEEYKKCISSPYYFYITYVEIETSEGKQKATTRMPEEEFNKTYHGKKNL